MEKNQDFFKYAQESGIQLNKCSISIGFVIKVLDEIEDLLEDSNDCEEHKENLMMAAYVSRIGILDRVDKFPVWLEANFDITIPKSQTTQTKMKMKKAMSLSVERLKKIASSNYSVNNIVRDMLSGGSAIQEFEDMLPPQAKMQIDVFCQKE